MLGSCFLLGCDVVEVVMDQIRIQKFHYSLYQNAGGASLFLCKDVIVVRSIGDWIRSVLQRVSLQPLTSHASTPCEGREN
ncbi:hypothetical protein Tco_0588079 [Tanacetum coccineum]